MEKIIYAGCAVAFFVVMTTMAEGLRYLRNHLDFTAYAVLCLIIIAVCFLVARLIDERDRLLRDRQLDEHRDQP